MTDASATAAYLDAWFRYVDWSGLTLEVRGLGEKGTDKEGKFREVQFIKPVGDLPPAAVMRHVDRWSANGIGSFIVPSPLRASVSDHAGGAREEDIALALGLIVDLDKGDTDASLARVIATLRHQPTMVIRSGGTTDTGAPKRHVYWRFSEPETEVLRVAAMRKALALHVGGDPAFGRVTQIIRIPGSIHGKGGTRTPVVIESIDPDCEIHFSDAAEIIEALPLPQSAAPTTQGFLDFSRGAGLDRMPIEDTLTSDIAEGGTEDRSRWSEFNRAAGFHINLARQGAITIQEAADRTRDWMHVHMHPAWPEERFRTEFRGLVNHHVEQNGPLPAAITASEPLRLATAQPGEVLPFRLAVQSVSRLMKGKAPARRFLIDGIIPYGKPQLWVADGGVGKTWALLQLGMSVAGGPGCRWLSSKVADWVPADGKAVLLVAEDDLDEVHARVDALDPESGFRDVYGHNLIVLPLPNMGGAFGLVEPDARRQAQPAKRWAELLELLTEIPNLQLVGIDTYSALLHGEENAANIANEWCRVAIEPICGKLGSTLVVTHHVRKIDEKQIIRTAPQMRNAIRGTTALPNNFRSVIGMWPDPDWKQHMKLLAMKPKEGVLFKLAVLKANNPDIIREEVALARDDTGGLKHHEAASALKAKTILSAEKAWLLYVIRVAAKDGFPFTKTAFNGRRGEIPCHLPGKTRIAELVDELVSEGLVVQNRRRLLDVPGGRFERGEDLPKDGAWRRPDYEALEYDDALGEIVPRAT